MQTPTNSRPAFAGAMPLRADACDAMADPIEPAELFDADVDQFAGLLTLKAAHWLSRFQRSKPIEDEPTQDATDGGPKTPTPGDLLARTALPAQGLDRRAGGGAVWPGDDRGRRNGPADHPRVARKRVTHLEAVFAVTLN